jgi:energy-coupling factor transporter transmembrane protein EcfT
MWQIIWMLNLLPDWVFHTLLITSVIAVIASYVLKKIPFINQYSIPLRVIGVLLIIFTVWVEGGRDVQHAWESKVKDLEEKVAVAEAKSQETNVIIKEKVVKKLELVRTRGEDIIKYIDREVATDKEVIKFVENCPIPEVIVRTHNNAASDLRLKLDSNLSVKEAK